MNTSRPNKSPEPTAVGACSSAIAVHAARRRWLSFFRSAQKYTNMKHILIITALICLTLISLTACQTTVKATDHISLGMTSSDVIAHAGSPYRKTASIQNGIPTEQWIYRETTWDQGGWSWNRTVMDTAILFQGGKVISYGPFQERHIHENPMRPTLNMNVTETRD